VNPVNPFYACYCSSNLGGSGCGSNFITNVSILTTPLNNSTTCNSTPTSGSYSQFMPGPSTTATLNAGGSFSISVTTNQSNIISLWIDYNQNGIFDATEHTQVALSGTAAVALFNVPATALTGLTGMRVRTHNTGNPNGPTDACTNFWAGETEDYVVNISPAVVCLGAPSSNTISASLFTICPSTTTTLNLVNTYTVTGLTYQWQSASALAGPYTAISGATLSSYVTPTLASNTFYRVVVTCTAGPASTTISPVQITVGGSPCQCLSYCPSAASSVADDEIFNVTIGTLNNTSSCATLAGGLGSILNRYSNYAGVLAPVNLGAAASHAFSVTVGQCGSFAYSGGVTIYIDYNQNGSFTDPGEQVFVSPSTTFSVTGTLLTGTIAIPASATSGITRMRVIAVESATGTLPCAAYTWGETEDYCINITPAPICSGAPGANTITAVQSTICPSSTTTLSLANSYSVTGFTYQWQSAGALAGPYTAIPGATLNTYGTASLTANTFYNCIITCTAGPTSITVAPIQISVGGSPCQCLAYCASAASSTADDEIFNVSIGTLNNTSSCATLAGGLGSIQNRYSNYAGVLAPVNLPAAATIPFSVTVGQCSGFAYSGGVEVYLDLNQNGSFTDPGEQLYSLPATTLFAVTGSTITGNITIPASATSGVTRMRVIAVESAVGTLPCAPYTWGETEDYCVNIIPATPCSGAPGANTVTALQTTICPGFNTNLGLLNSYTVSGLSYQWQSAVSLAGPYTTIPSATNVAYTTPTLASTTFYQCVITCTSGPASTTASPIGVNVIATTTNNVPYFEGFEGIALNNQLPNCSWSASSPTTICRTYTAATGVYNQVAHTGNKFASFLYNGNTNGEYFWSSGIQLTAGVTYSAGAWYITDGLAGWNEFALLYGTTQSSVGLTSIVSVTSALTNTVYNPIGATFTVPTTGIYYIAVKNIATFPPWFFTWDDLSVTTLCSSPTITASASNPSVCAGGSSSLTVTGAASSYSWNTGSTSTVIVVSPSVSTVYTITASNGPGCNSTQTVAVGISAPPTLSISGSNTVCANNNLTLTVSGASNYTWNPTSQTTSVVVVTPSVNTTYSVIGSASGCTATANQNVSVTPSPTVGVTPSQSICAGTLGVTTLTTASTGNTFTWSPGNSNNNTIVVPTPTTTSVYSVTATNPQGCRTTVTTTLTVQNCAGVNEKSIADNTLIYPNPTNGLVNVTLAPGLNNCTIEVYDVTGKLVKSTQINQTQSTLDLKDFANGLYTYKVKSAAKTVIKEGKIVKE
jgi:hypothetical protein